MKILKKILLWFFLVSFILLMAGIIIGFIYGDEVKKIVITELNKNLLTEVSVKHVDFSVIKRFPYASVEFTDVVIKESSEKAIKDTLVRASSLYLFFNISDILHGKYNLKKIHLKNAFVNPETDINGKENYRFWKERKEETDGTFNISIEEIILSNVSVFYSDLKSHHKLLFKTEHSVLNGNFSDEEFKLKAKSDLFAEELTFGNVTYVKKQAVSFFAGIKIDKAKFLWSVEKSEVKVANLSLVVEGTIYNHSPESDINLKIKGNNINIESLLSLLPKEYRSYTENYRGKGVINFNGSISSSANKAAVVKASFGVTNGEFSQNQSSLKAENIFLDGLFDSSADKLQINEFRCKIGKGEFSGNFIIENFKNPQLQISLLSSFELDEFFEFFPSEKIEEINGKVIIDATFLGKLKNKEEYTSEDFRRSKSSGKLVFSEVNVRLKEDLLVYEDLSAELLFDNNDIIIKKMSCKISESDFELKGFFRNVIGWFVSDDQNLVVDAQLKSKKINLNELLTSGGNSSKDTLYNLNFTEKASFYLDLNASEIVFRKFEAKDVSGRMVLADKMLRLINVHFDAVDGKIIANGSIDGTNSELVKLNCIADINNINIQKLFYQFENFGQQQMQDKHISGIASAAVHFMADANNTLDINKKTIYTRAALTIDKGELKEFQPLMKLSNYIKVPDLQNVKFATLSNTIEIKEEKLFLPKMDINSSAIDISLSGIHSFNNDIDYRFRLLLSDVLAKKAKDSNKNNTEFGYIEEDDRKRMSIFLAMKGTADNPKFSYDGVGMKEKVKTDVAAEKNIIKSLLKDEFGVFKSDSSLKSPQEVKTIKYQVEWEEEDEKKKSEVKEKQKPSLTPENKEKGKFGKWLDKVAGPEHKKEFE